MMKSRDITGSKKDARGLVGTMAPDNLFMIILGFIGYTEIGIQRYIKLPCLKYYEIKYMTESDTFHVDLIFQQNFPTQFDIKTVLFYLAHIDAPCLFDRLC